VRTGIVGAAGGLIQDAVVTGHDGDEIGMLAWVAGPAAERLVGRRLDPTEPARDPVVRQTVRTAVERYNSANNQSSTRIARLLLLADPPSVDHNEITDKGYINQRAVLERRAADVARLHGATPTGEVAIFPHPITE
jgi:feruloyl-CoA synthase